MAPRSTPPKAAKPRPARQSDDSWDELVIGALGDPAPSPTDSDIFDRDTQIPKVPPEEAARLELESLAPRRGNSDPFALTSEPPELPPDYLPEADPFAPASNIPTIDMRTPPQGGHGTGRRANSSPPSSRGHRTRPEPVVERYVDRLEQGATLPPAEAASVQRRWPMDSEPPTSPLDLVETYRTSTDSFPGVVATGPASAPRSPENGTLQDMQDRYAVGDFTGALVVAESILDTQPDDEDAKRYAQSCREVLTQMYAARIGPMDQVAVVAVPPEQITWLSLDHRAGFLLSLVDGVSSIEEILDISGMSRLDALRIMYTLVQQNVITLGH